MNVDGYNVLARMILMGLLAAMIAAAAFLVAAIIGWRGPFRNRRLAKCAACVVLCPVLYVAQIANLVWVLGPALGREAKRIRKERVDADSVVTVGDKAPSFRVKAIDGAEVSLDDCRGKVILLKFFATWCVPCLHEMPHLQEIWNANQDRKDFTILAVGVGAEQTDESLAAFKMKHGYAFPFIADPESSVYSLYARDRIPRTILISRDGTILFSVSGFGEGDLDLLKNALAAEFQ